MTDLYDVAAIGNAIVDVIAPATDDFLSGEGLTKGAMILVDEVESAALYGRMAPGLEASGGSARRCCITPDDSWPITHAIRLTRRESR